MNFLTLISIIAMFIVYWTKLIQIKHKVLMGCMVKFKKIVPVGLPTPFLVCLNWHIILDIFLLNGKWQTLSQSIKRAVYIGPIAGG